MKEEQKIYIRGSKDRSSDVRKILEQHGGKVEAVANFTYDNCIYYINHDGIVDYTHEGSELCNMLIEYYHQVELPNPEHWERGDVLVSDNNLDRFFIFDKFDFNDDILVYLEVIKGHSEYNFSKINAEYHIVHYEQCHKANDKELKTFYDTLAARDLTWNAYNNKLLHGNYTYFYPKNGHYYFRRDTIRCKDRTTGEWYDAVLYSDANGQYVREVKDFNTKFKLCQ